MMNFSFKLFTVFILFVISTFLLSCTKEGAPGPKGDNGTSGLQGVSGKAGATGISGITGVIGATGAAGGTVLNTKIISITASDWTYTFNSAYTDKANADISNALINNGVVLAYMQGATTSTWIALPTTVFVAGSPPLNFGFSYSEGTIKFTVTQNGPGAPSNIQAYTFKIVAMQ